MALFSGSIPVQRLRLGSEASAAYYGSTLVWQAGDAGADWFYSTEESGVTLLLYRGTAKSLTVPAMIDGLPVTALAATACNYADVTSVTIPAGVMILA